MGNFSDFHKNFQKNPAPAAPLSFVRSPFPLGLSLPLGPFILLYTLPFSTLFQCIPLCFLVSSCLPFSTRCLSMPFPFVMSESVNEANQAGVRTGVTKFEVLNHNHYGDSLMRSDEQITNIEENPK